MASMGRPTKALVLDAEERSKLELVARRPKTSQRQALRARIVLACASGLSNRTVAARVAITVQTVGKWRERFRVHRLEGLTDEPRPGAPRTITDRLVEDVITKTLETTPRGQTHWSTRAMARETGISADSVSRIWRAFGLKPHRTSTFKLSPDPFFVEKVRDIVGLYLDPPAHAVVFSLDEKAQMQALERTQPLLPMRPGQIERRTHDYVRHGTTALFAALNVATGTTIRACFRRHRHQEFLKFLRRIDEAVPHDGTAIHLILDNYGTHKTPAVRRWFAKRPRYHLHFTPTYASWLNLVERLFAEVTEKAVRRGSHGSVRALEDAVLAYLAARDEVPRPFVWTADADLILDRVKNLSERISRTGH